MEHKNTIGTLHVFFWSSAGCVFFCIICIFINNSLMSVPVITAISVITSEKAIFCARKVAAVQSSSRMLFGQRLTTRPIKLLLTVRTGLRHGKTGRLTYSSITPHASREETKVSGSVGRSVSQCLLCVVLCHFCFCVVVTYCQTFTQHSLNGFFRSGECWWLWRSRSVQQTRTLGKRKTPGVTP